MLVSTPILHVYFVTIVDARDYISCLMGIQNTVHWWSKWKASDASVQFQDTDEFGVVNRGSVSWYSLEESVLFVHITPDCLKHPWSFLDYTTIR